MEDRAQLERKTLASAGGREVIFAMSRWFYTLRIQLHSGNA
jgi:hypothetical protein